MNYYSTPIYMQQSHVANDNGISIEDNYSGVTVCDRVLRRFTVLQRDEIIYNPDILHYVKDRHLAQRRHIVHLLDAHFMPCYCFGTSLYLLLGSRLGPMVAAIAQSISDIQCTIYDWPDDYDKSSSWMLSNLDKSYNQYKMHLQLFGESNIYTEEQFRLVHELLELVKSAVIK